MPLSLFLLTLEDSPEIFPLVIFTWPISFKLPPEDLKQHVQVTDLRSVTKELKHFNTLNLINANHMCISVEFPYILTVENQN